MAPTPDVYTDRYWLRYQGAGGTHEMLFRFLPATPDADAKAKILEVVTTLKVFVPVTTSFNGMRFAAAGSVNSFPTTWASVAGTNGAGVPANGAPAFFTWVGRDSGGTRIRLTLLGTVDQPDANYRRTPAESPSVAAVIASLRDVTPTAIVTVAGLIPIWADYANVGYNAYFQRKLRRS